MQTPTGAPQAIARAHIELMDLPGLGVDADDRGNYVLRNVPVGPHFVFTRTQFGTSDLLPVDVQGSVTRLDITLGSSSPFTRPRIARGRVITEQGAAIGGAVVWIFDKQFRAMSEPDGSFQLVYYLSDRLKPINLSVSTFPLAFIAATNDRWGFAPGDGSSTPTIVLNQRTRKPSAPVQVYDFIAHADTAAWTNNSGNNIWKTPLTSTRGSASIQNNVTLEDGSKPSHVLEIHPQAIANGLAQGKYPAMIPQGDYTISARVGFVKGAGQGSVTFVIQFDPDAGNTVELYRDKHDYSSALVPIYTGFPSQVIGKRGRIILSVEGGTPNSSDKAVWVEPQIISGK